MSKKEMKNESITSLESGLIVDCQVHIEPTFENFYPRICALSATGLQTVGIFSQQPERIKSTIQYNTIWLLRNCILQNPVHENYKLRLVGFSK